MSEDIKYLWLGMPIGMYVVLILAVGLLVASFIVPPLGTISPSVLQALAEMLGFSWLIYLTANIPFYIEKGAKIKASYGGAQIEIGRHRKNKGEREEDNDTEEFDDRDR